MICRRSRNTIRRSKVSFAASPIWRTFWPRSPAPAASMTSRREWNDCSNFVPKVIPVSTPIADIRKDYKLRSLSENDILRDPIPQFDKWWQEALHAGIEEPNAMTLATASADGMPDARIVLLKAFDSHGFTFFTNYNSAKGRDR